MDPRKWLFCSVLLVAGSGFVVFSLSHGQDRTITPASAPAGGTVFPRPSSAVPERLPRDFSKLPPLQQQMHLSAQRAADWLCRANQSDGHFLPGYVPALRTPLEGDHYLRQVGAAFALARAARFLGQDRYAAVARQAILTLLVETAIDPQDARCRHTNLPPLLVNPIGAAGLLILAINELPSPGEDLLEQSEQLCAYLRAQQRGDGALRGSDSASESPIDPEETNSYPGEGLYGLMRSGQYRPAAWKIEVVRKALPYYRDWWRAHKSLTFIPWQTAAYSEAYLLTGERSFADFVIEMNDWLCEHQYVQLDPRQPLWLGGFKEGIADGALASAPRITSASYAEGLADACRVARQAQDRPRYQKYRDALERCLQFLTTLQYTEANTQHFADWYRPVLAGAFFNSHQDGNLRVDSTQHALSALVRYLQEK